jgi:rhodanese-related sulfurtransferase
MMVAATDELHSLDKLISEMTFDFFGSGQHKISVDKLFSQPEGILLDIRSKEDVETLSLPLAHDITVLHIPTDEIPKGLGEILIDQPVAIFCSAGMRAAIIYAYLRIKNYTQVRILVGGLEDLVKHAKPGSLRKRLQSRGGSE